MKVLIGYDGSESSDRIFEDLTRAGFPRDTEALVVTVGDLLMSGPPAGEIVEQMLTSERVAAALKQAETHAERVIGEAEELSLNAVERLRSRFPEWKIENRVVTGNPGWELVDAAKDWSADLVVVGSQGRSAIGRLFLGSVSKRIATDANCSVRVARAAAPKGQGEPAVLIIGVDGSPAAEEAIYAVGRRVWPSGTEVRLVTVDDGIPPTGVVARLPQAAEMINSYLQTRARRVTAMLDWATGELNNIGLKTSVLTAKGDPKSVLLEEARRWSADCIFVGTRDFQSSFERFRLGSVSTAVVTNAHCSVEIVRPVEGAARSTQ
jgi:nucleotide-binding universal stress UspA family protein